MTVYLLLEGNRWDDGMEVTAVYSNSEKINSYIESHPTYRATRGDGSTYVVKRQFSITTLELDDSPDKSWE